MGVYAYFVKHLTAFPMTLPFKKLFLSITVCLCANLCKAQLVITSQSNAQALAQKLVGDGVSISNVTLVADSRGTGFFNNISGTNIGIDSGIVLTNGRAKSIGTGEGELGLDGVNGITITSLEQGAAGDADLEALVNDQTHDACVLEFDFVPLGDSIKFRYILSSEEYPVFACSNFNDAFAFFIQGPGFPVPTNIALIPGTTLPVTINNVNGEACTGLPQFPQFYVDNAGNAFFTHNGHTVVLTAAARVQPCQTYHLKLVIADVGDERYDSGVFLEAKSLTSNAFQLTNLTQVDGSGQSYLVEGCAVGALKIRRQSATLFSQIIDLGYGGTAINGIDVQTLPSSITIPANETEVLLNIFPIIDNIPEGIETLKIYTLAACGIATPTDSTMIQIRDYDTLGIAPHRAVICPGGSIQLAATTGYITYQWQANPGLSSTSIINPVATPLTDSTIFICTSEEGTCHGRDSAFIVWKRLKLVSTRDVNCHLSATGQIVVSTDAEWLPAVEYSINNGPFQSVATFNNLIVGTYTIKVKDATGCIDSLVVNINQAYPDLLITNAVVVNGSCTGTADGKITVTATGGKPALQYSVDGISFQNSNIFNVAPGTYTVTVKDNNGCTSSLTNVLVQFNNTMTLSMGASPTMCEGKNAIITATTNGSSVVWSPAATLSNATSLTPVANPTTTTQYYVTATLGLCSKKDSVFVLVNPAPHANAGNDSTICYGADTRLLGSGGVIYKWEPASYLSSTDTNNPRVTKPATITYLLTVTDANGCVSLSKDDVVISVSKPAKLFAGNDTAVAINQPLQLNAVDVNNTGFVKYYWAPSTGLNDPFIKNPVAVLTAADVLFIVTASTANSCEGIDSIRIKTYKGPEIYVPTSFTPNGDGINDVLRAFPVGIKSFTYFKVFNRFGQMVFYTTNQQEGWDGRIKGSLQNMSSFVWIAEAVDYFGRKLQRKGTTTIIQ